MARLVIGLQGVYLDDMRLTNVVHAHVDFDAREHAVYAQLVLVHAPGEAELDTGEGATVRIVHDEPSPQIEFIRPT